MNIETLKRNEANRDINLKHVKELANSILINGLLQPPVVSERERNTYYIISGHHRVAACDYLVEMGYIDFMFIKCIVVEKNSLDEELALIDSNIETRPLTPYEMMNAIGRKEQILREKKDRGEKVKGTLRNVIAASIEGLKDTQVGTYLRIYKKATEGVKTALKEDKITLSKAYQLSGLSSEKQNEALKEIKDKKDKDKSKDLFVEDVERNLEKYLETKVNIEGKQIKIYCDGTDDLNRLLEIIGYFNKF